MRRNPLIQLHSKCQHDANLYSVSVGESQVPLVYRVPHRQQLGENSGIKEPNLIKRTFTWFTSEILPWQLRLHLIQGRSHGGRFAPSHFHSWKINSNFRCLVGKFTPHLKSFYWGGGRGVDRKSWEMFDFFTSIIRKCLISTPSINLLCYGSDLSMRKSQNWSKDQQQIQGAIQGGEIKICQNSYSFINPLLLSFQIICSP